MYCSRKSMAFSWWHIHIEGYEQHTTKEETLGISLIHTPCCSSIVKPGLAIKTPKSLAFATKVQSLLKANSRDHISIPCSRPKMHCLSLWAAIGAWHKEHLAKARKEKGMLIKREDLATKKKGLAFCTWYASTAKKPRADQHYLKTRSLLFAWHFRKLALPQTPGQ